MDMDYVKTISIVYRKMQMFLSSELKPYSIGYGQQMYITCICEHSGVTQNQLAEILLMDKSTVAKMITSLELNGFVTRISNKEDGRAFDVFPTQKSLDIYKTLNDIKHNWFIELTKDLTDVEKTMMTQLLAKSLKSISDAEY